MAINLSELKKSTLKPPRILVHGGEGVGKTTFACGAPDVYLLDLEKGRAMCDPLMAQEPDSYTEVMEHLKALATQEHGYKTLVVDSLDMLESMITAYVCEQNGWKAITEPAYGKGYGARTDMCWAPFWRALDYLRDTKNMMVILIAHSQIVKVEDPILPGFDSYTLHLYKTESAKAIEWPDVVGYCAIKTYTIKDGARNLATTAGERVILTRKNPAYTAKNRYNMPEEIPLVWSEFAKYLGTNTKEMN
jgi:hypothetical protein